MLERRICIILAALLTGCGAASPGAEVNGAEANEPPDGRKLHATKDIRGERDDEKFKAEVRADVAKLGGLVKIVERTWRIKSRDAGGIMY